MTNENESMDKKDNANIPATTANTNTADLALVQDINLGLDLVNRRDEAFAFFKDLLEGRTSGVTSPSEAMLVYGRCRELALPFMATLDHMCVIQGKVCADIHIKSALALRAGHSLYWEKVKDYEPQYKYTDGTNEWISHHKPVKFLQELAKEDPMATTLAYAWDDEQANKVIEAGKKPFGNIMGHNVPFDNVTIYKFYRVRTLKNGEEKTLTANGKFSRQMAITAQLGFGRNGSDYEDQVDPNGNWGKYNERMVDVRAFDNGLKEIASDLTMGMPEISEMAEAYSLSYNVDPSTGNAQVTQAIDVQEAEIVKED